MSDETTTPAPANNPRVTPRTPLLFKEDSTAGESRALNISLRGWIALGVVGSYCAACLLAGRTEAPGLLKDVAIMVVTYYFATRTAKT